MTPGEKTLQDGWAGAPRQVKPEFVHDAEIIAAWRGGKDTRAIGLRLFLPESQIANRLARLRDAGAV